MDEEEDYYREKAYIEAERRNTENNYIEEMNRIPAKIVLKITKEETCPQKSLSK